MSRKASLRDCLETLTTLPSPQFELDSDFNETMYQRQVAVLKGQGYNLLQSLKQVVRSSPLTLSPNFD